MFYDYHVIIKRYTIYAYLDYVALIIVHDVSLDPIILQCPTLPVFRYSLYIYIYN